MKIKKSIYALIVVSTLLILATWKYKKYNFNRGFSIGQPLDSLHGVVVYFNGGVKNVSRRNITQDGYNLGLEYQCVEFAKRYYYEHLNHKMPDSYGHAIDFFDKTLRDGQINQKRDLYQYSNPSLVRPRVGDLVVYSETIFNKYGHVAIVSKVMDTEIEIIQQNPGPFSKSRETFLLTNKDGQWRIEYNRILGWLRKE